MQCDYCAVGMIETRATKEEPYVYELSGLKKVFLIGIVVQRCPKCGFESPMIPRIASLHQTIADLVVKKTAPLNGEEIRFLRKHAGFSARQFARVIEVDPTHLSRVENGHTKHLGSATDKLVRLYTRMAKDDQSSRDLLVQIANEADRRERSVKRARLLRIEAVLERNQWMAPAA
jgi:putative zinc finger/helix-turn-helix YgiT family protein